MERQKELEIKKYSLLILFVVMLMGLSLLNFFKRDRDFSEIENRYLQKKPRFEINKFKNGSYGEQYEKYVNDQFIFRDGWITIKTLSEIKLLSKEENNNVVLGKDRYLFDKLEAINKEKEKRNIGYIRDFIEKKSENKVFFSIVPNSYEILKDKLPFGLKNIDQTQEIDKIYKKLAKNNKNNLFLIDAVKCLSNKNDGKNKIYYSTDHHWTTQGAYYFYCQLANFLGYSPIDLRTLKKHTIPDFYGTYFSRSKITWVKADNIIYYDIPIVSLEINNQSYPGLYDLEKFYKKDKYAAFLYGNNGLSIINSLESKDKKDHICIIKDSYANSLIPFLTCNYNKIYIIDLRYINIKDLSNLANNYNIDNFLIVYNFINFISDNFISKLEYF